MDFLDTLIDLQTENTTRRLNYMISVALLTPDEKTWYEMNAYKFTETEARKHIEELQEFMPIMGYHSIPQNVSECVQATKFAVEKDNHHEIRWNKNQ